MLGIDTSEASAGVPLAEAQTLIHTHTHTHEFVCLFGYTGDRFLKCTEIPVLWALGKTWYDKLAGGKEVVWHIMCEQLGRQYVTCDCVFVFRFLFILFGFLLLSCFCCQKGIRWHVCVRLVCC